MRQFFLRAALLLAPFAVYAAAIVALDPYDLFEISHLAPDTVKEKTSVPLNQCLWKMIEYRRKPCENILLGDSRMGELNPDLVSRVAGERYYDFHYGGASLNEIVDTFWYASSLVKLKHVYIGVNFNLYSDYNYSARTDSYRSLETNPLLYFTNRTVLKAAYYTLSRMLTGADPEFGVPKMSREEYWRNQIGPVTAAWYGRYVYPVRYHKELVKIGEYCRKNGVQLRFVIFPSHIELQNRVHDFGLDSAYATFKTDLAAIATTYDYDFDSAISEDKNNYRDPLHFIPAVSQMLIQDIWTGKLDHGRVLPSNGATGEKMHP